MDGMQYLILATNEGVVVLRRERRVWEKVRRGMPDHEFTSVIAREGVILAGGPEGVFRSADLGATWEPASEGLEIRHVRWLAYHPSISDFELAGTEPAGIFVSRDEAETWRSCPEVIEMRQEYGWHLPYSPEAGAVRGFAVNGPRAYAAVEDGCVLVSDDGGEHWRLAEGSLGRPDHAPAENYVHSDVHSIAVHPSSPDLVYAATGGGFYRSWDGGVSWQARYPGCYCRAVWVDPNDPDHILLGPADGVDRNGRIEESSDGGRTWSNASFGLAVPWRSHMVERFTQADDTLMAVLSNGDLIAAPLRVISWRPILDDLAGVRAAAVMI